MWALYFVYARKAAVLDLAPQDVILLRFGVGGIICLPWLWMLGPRDLGGIGWRRGALLALCVGPLFLGAAAWGFHFAPLAHGAVLQPSTAAVVATLVAVAALGERLRRAQVVGLILVLGGIGLIGATAAPGLVPGAWRGHVLFLGAGTLWAAFTIALRVWGVGGVAATVAVNVISALVVLPLFALFGDPARLLALPVPDLLTQVLVHGVLVAVAAMATYGWAVSLLGIGSAALFPAVVPAVALIIGGPLAGEWPSPVEWVGAIVATAGLAVAMGAVPGLRRFGL